MQLCFNLIHEWLLKNPEASICTAQGAAEFRDIAIFQDYHGLAEFREVKEKNKKKKWVFNYDLIMTICIKPKLMFWVQAVAKFMGKVRRNRASFDPDRIVMSGGATGAHEMIAFCLADPGDAFLVPTPYYPG